MFVFPVLRPESYIIVLFMTLSFTQLTELYTSIGHIIIGQLHYLWGKKVEQSIIVCFCFDCGLTSR